MLVNLIFNKVNLNSVHFQSIPSFSQQNFKHVLSLQYPMLLFIPQISNGIFGAGKINMFTKWYSYWTDWGE